MKWISLLILLMWMPVRTSAHPLHLSITNITLENGKLKITMKTFPDDWKTGYFHYHSKEAELTDPEGQLRPWYQEYLDTKFRIAREEGAEPLPLVLDSLVVTEDAMTLEMSCALNSEPNSLYIYNALLIDIYPDQTNLVIFGFKKKETGIKFDFKKHSAEVLLK
ncbi:MAG: DUF6702 family protein [Bacteroidales bacterium]